MYGCNTLFSAQVNVGIWRCTADKGFVSAVYFVAGEPLRLSRLRAAGTRGHVLQVKQGLYSNYCSKAFCFR